MLKILLTFIGLLFLTPESPAQFDPVDVPWMASLQKSKVFFIHVCGSADIMPTRKSLARDFILGPKDDGYFFTETPGIPEYWTYVREHTLQEAKAALQTRFNEAHLWRYTPDQLVDLGKPTKMEFPFIATIKDCMNGSKNSLGLVCNSDMNRKACCAEKFAGPVFYWGPNQDYALKFSPDPSVQLRVKGEKKNRFCNFQQIIEVKGAGR